MNGHQKLIKELRQRKDQIRKGGGEKGIEKQHRAGKLTARERLDILLDPGTFVEIGMFGTHHSTDFGMEKSNLPGDGVITGWGKIHGRLVYLVAQDYTVMSGTMGPTHMKKTYMAMDRGIEARVPLVMLNDSGGVRPQEQFTTFTYSTQIFRRHTSFSGVIPQISVIMGPVAGGPCYGPALTDFIFMVKGTSSMFIGGPPVVKALVSEDVTIEELGGAKIHGEISGVADFIAQNEQECLEKVKELLDLFPSNNGENPPRISPKDNPDRQCHPLLQIVPPDPRKSYDMHLVIKEILDEGYFFEMKPHYAKNIITGFGRLNGMPVGITANQPNYMAGCIDIDASDKAARFIRFCDCFNIPLINLLDTPGYLVGKKMEYQGIIRHGAKMLYARSEATVPQITIVLRKAYAGAFVAMGDRGVGTDYVFLWPTAEVALFGPETAINIICRRETAEVREQRLKEYKEKFINVYYPASFPEHIDGIIEPQETRSILIKSLEVLSTKQPANSFPKKHGNIPL
jgi:acetyl-CoA carboxylase carboxyltransferase component